MQVWHQMLNSSLDVFWGYIPSLNIVLYHPYTWEQYIQYNSKQSLILYSGGKVGNPIYRIQENERKCMFRVFLWNITQNLSSFPLTPFSSFGSKKIFFVWILKKIPYGFPSNRIWTFFRAPRGLNFMIFRNKGWSNSTTSFNNFHQQTFKFSLRLF